MAETTEIAWCDSTWNPVIGCQNVSPGCDHCYAEKLNDFRKWTEWGPHGVRRRTSAENWRKPIIWNRDADRFRKANGHRQRIFSGSLCDVFDNKIDAQTRDDFWRLIADTPRLDWLLLTKRPQNIAKMLPPDWGDGYPNVWLGTTTEDQEHYNQRWPHLARVPAAIRFISYEPAIGALSILDGAPVVPDWVIFGGESGSLARPAKPQWARDIERDCDDLGIPYFRKQWGSYESNPIVAEQGRPIAEARILDPDRGPFANGKGGALLDGELRREFPETPRQSRTSPGQSHLSPASV